ncbi:hypothetical protein [Streptomyces sp. NPDC052012]|uniref:hypothetical protein n=1 Tax=Streptomyces sp. NPDC052012 TaxID=3155051 RepID=UPI00344D7C76
MQFGEAAEVVVWLHSICAYAVRHGNWDLLEEAAHTMCTWDRWSAQDKITPWLRTLKDQAALVIAAVLRDHPGVGGRTLAARRRR